MTGSSNLASAGYHPKSKVLEVEFRSGAVYRFSGVPGDVTAELRRAESPGSLFHERIKGAFPHKRVSGPTGDSTNRQRIIARTKARQKRRQVQREGHLPERLG